MSLTKKNKKIKLSDLASLVNGILSGNGATEISTVTSPEEAQKGSLVFILDRNMLKTFSSINASAFVIEGEKTENTAPCLFVKNGRSAMAKILPLFAPGKKCPKGKHKTAIIGKKVKLGKDVSVGPYVVIEDNVSIGKGTLLCAHAFIGENSKLGNACVIHPHATVYHDCFLGNNVILHSGVVIGVDGYGFAPEKEKFTKIPQIGRVVIEDDVEIYANTIVARGTLGATIIKKGTKIDCLVHIAHNCKIGENCAVVALVGFAGSVEIGNHVQIGGMVGFNGHVSVGDNSIIMGKAGVTKSLPAGSLVSGFPAIDHAKDMEIQAFTRKLPELYKRVSALEQKNSKS
ncbi:MAG: UDP-3-O-(3-hydroxymyristoyl)glucosamine N-acyltransferase [Candidatus Saganbacteria bacterium]|nr:UDP-3-O-(3-hydroxymyristoyl)glucosamine N-acyltransferase [Candidatus Saganbacteria bacterium]